MRYTHPLTAKNYGSQQKNFQAAFVTTFGAEIAAESIVNSVTDSHGC